MSAPGWLQRMLAGLPNAIKPLRPDDEPPTPITRARVANYLARRGYRFVADDDGDLTGTWDGNRFWFLLLGNTREILQVRGRWHRTLPLEARPALALAVNDWNRERIWPKAYIREEGITLAMYAETSADLEGGVNDAQLAQLLSCGLGSGVQMFLSFAATIPGPDDLESPDVPNR
ncbi:MAG: YbjN domain-containing protein [Micrococcales bacterium]|nr:YbjN domain-containing protein [Micrococcales bacterium]